MSTATKPRVSRAAKKAPSVDATPDTALIAAVDNSLTMAEQLLVLNYLEDTRVAALTFTEEQYDEAYTDHAAWLLVAR